MRRTILALTAVMLVSTGTAFAGGGQRGDFELGGYAGYGWLDNYGTFRPKNDMLYGARLGYFLTPYLNVEFSAQRLPTEATFGNPLLPERDVELTSYRGALGLSFLPGLPFRPYVSVGGGQEQTSIDGSGTTNDWGWNAGGGFRVFFTPNFAFRADGRVAGVRVEEPVNSSNRNVEASGGLSLLFGGREGDDVSPEPAMPANQPPVVSCVSDRAEVLPGESVRITANATDPDGDPLTYAWTASSGRVTGDGSSAMLSFDGATAPVASTVTVRVSDNHGNTATSECGVRLVEPVRQAEAVSCLAGGFPSNLSRVTNVDKACLDDVVQRLKADPRAKVIIVGHADSRERSAETLGKQRADAVEDYLEQAGIDATRITTRSAGAGQLLDTGTDAGALARNRRVEVWFVPEGAPDPDTSSRN